jgi:transposase-like protein
MARKGKSTEEIIGFLREAEVRLAQGDTAGKICRGAGISEQTYYKWRREYGGLKIDQAKRLKELERENERLKKAVSELTLDKQILKEARSGKYCALPARGRALITCARNCRYRSVERVWSWDSHARRNAANRKCAPTKRC